MRLPPRAGRTDAGPFHFARGSRSRFSVVCVLTTFMWHGAVAHAGIVGYTGGSTSISYGGNGGQFNLGGTLSENVLPGSPGLQLDSTINNFILPGITETDRAGAYSQGGSTSAGISLDLNTFSSISGGPTNPNYNPIGGFSGEWNGSWSYYIDNWANPAWYTTPSLHVYLQASLNVEVHGYIAPGDAAAVVVSGGGDLGGFGFGGGLNASTGVPGDIFVSTPGDFSFVVHLTGQPVLVNNFPDYSSPLTSLNVGLSFEALVQKGTQSSDETWLAVGDPGVTVQEVDANGNPIVEPNPVPEPSSILLWCTAAVCLAGHFRRTRRAAEGF